MDQQIAKNIINLSEAVDAGAGIPERRAGLMTAVGNGLIRSGDLRRKSQSLAKKHSLQAALRFYRRGGDPPPAGDQWSLLPILSCAFCIFQHTSLYLVFFQQKSIPHLVFRQLLQIPYGIMSTRSRGKAGSRRLWHRPAAPPPLLPAEAPPTPLAASARTAPPGAAPPVRPPHR